MHAALPLERADGRLGAVDRVRCAVGLGRRFSASPWLADVRRYGSTYFNYTGKPLAYLLATPELADDADNPLRVAFGNEGSPEVVDAFARRFGVEVIDAYGATEGGVAVNRDAEERPGARAGRARPVKVVDEDGTSGLELASTNEGRLLNAEECVGEIVNTAGVGPFEGYYNNPEANERTTRFGWYWSGDLGYLDDDGYLYFAGRNADWIRVDGENFPAGPSKRRAPCTIPMSCSPPCTACPTTKRAIRSWPVWSCATADLRSRARSPRGSTPKMESARSGDRDTCASCTTRPPPARTRS